MSPQTRAVLSLVVIAVAAFFTGAILTGMWLSASHQSSDSSTKTVTVEKTVPGPERTIYKRKPGTTTWIIVCGEQTQRVVNNKPTTECNLPDTGGQRRHKAH